MGLHHLTLKAAVAKYGTLNGSMPVEALKAEIAKDEKGFSPEDVEEIYSAIVVPAEGKSTLFPPTGDIPQPSTESQPAAGLDLKNGILLKAETPEWVAEILDSHKAVLASNQAVINALTELKDRASRTVGNYQQDVQKEVSSEFDPEMDYQVADGKEFRAPNDFTTIHKEGDNVNHLGKEKLKSLLAQGLVTPVDPED